MRYIRRYGIPRSVYLDKHSTYKSPAAPTLTEQLEGQAPQSQFERALSELGVEVIHAHSPQAKGRIERLFKTFQDRLIKEMRLAGIATLEDANRFVAGYVPIYNRRFSVQATQAADLHRPIAPGWDLNRMLCIKTERVLRKDFTVVHGRKLYQIEDSVQTKRVMVEERVNGSMQILHQGQRLRYREIATRPVKISEPVPRRLSRRGVKPAADHPWNRRILLPKEKGTGASGP